VSAKDQGTGKEQSMTIRGGSALTKEDIDQMVSDAEAHAEEDRMRSEEAETRNQAESLVHQTEQGMKDHEDKLPEESKQQVQTAIDEVNEAVKGEDAEAIKSAVEKLATESQSLGQALYADSGEATGTEDATGAAGATAGSTGADEQGSAQDDVVDAEVVDDEDQKKR